MLDAACTDTVRHSHNWLRPSLSHHIVLPCNCTCCCLCETRLQLLQDVAVFIKEYNYEDRKAARELVTGLHLGGLVLEAKDVEVLTKVRERERFTGFVHLPPAHIW